MGKKRQTSAEDQTLTSILREAIQGSGISLGELSRKTGISTPQLSRFMRGERTFTLPLAEKLMIFFGLTVVRPAKPDKN
jgi:transcriptional regulator with XRE-family HTH domain